MRRYIILSYCLNNYSISQEQKTHASLLLEGVSLWVVLFAISFLSNNCIYVTLDTNFKNLSEQILKKTKKDAAAIAVNQCLDGNQISKALLVE